MHENKFAPWKADGGTPTCTSRTFPWSARHRRLFCNVSCWKHDLWHHGVMPVSPKSNHFCANVILIGNAHICASWRIRSAWSHILVHQNSSMRWLCWRVLLKMPMLWKETLRCPNWCSNKYVWTIKDTVIRSNFPASKNFHKATRKHSTHNLTPCPNL